MFYLSSIRLSYAINWLYQGKIIAYPTEAVYGLGCDPLNEQAVTQLLLLKHRPMAKGLILIAANLQQVLPFIQVNQTIIDRVKLTWPGPITWVVPAQSWVPYWLTGQHDTLAVRVSAHPLVYSLCNAFGGPLISTSANPTGKPSPLNAIAVKKYFPQLRVHLFKGDTGALKQTSAIIDAVTGKVLR